MRSGSPEAVAPGRVGDVGVRARIDEELLVALAQKQAERVGVAVSGAAGTEWTGVGDELHIILGHHDQAAVGESDRAGGWFFGARGLLQRAEPPCRLFQQMPRISNPIAAIEKRAASGQGRQAEPVTRSVWMK